VDSQLAASHSCSAQTASQNPKGGVVMGRKSRIKKLREQKLNLPPRKVRQIQSLVDDLQNRTFSTVEEAREAASNLSKALRQELNRPIEEDN
jgi:hypothetical protein